MNIDDNSEARQWRAFCSFVTAILAANVCPRVAKGYFLCLCVAGPVCNDGGRLNIRADNDKSSPIFRRPISAGHTIDRLPRDQ